eukprot:417463-Pelagomonas_calceolata.AAC.2
MHARADAHQVDSSLSLSSALSFYDDPAASSRLHTSHSVTLLESSESSALIYCKIMVATGAYQTTCLNCWLAAPRAMHLSTAKSQLQPVRTRPLPCTVGLQH